MQKLVHRLLPEKWANSIRSQSESWRIRCCTCGASRTVWEAGGVRWGAASVARRKLVHCSNCGGLRRAAVEKVTGDQAKAASSQG